MIYLILLSVFFSNILFVNTLTYSRDNDILDNFLVSTKIKNSRTSFSLKNEGDNFLLIGFSLDFEYIYYPEITCNYDTTCGPLICNTLANKTLSSMGLAYISLQPLPGITLSCNKQFFNKNSSVIEFIINPKTHFILPYACSTIGDCFEKGCISFNTAKDNLAIAFMGQCL